MKSPSPVSVKIIASVLFLTLLIGSLLASCGPSINKQRDAMINDLNNLAGQAYLFKLRPDSLGGGGGSFLGFTIPQNMLANENATYTTKELTALNVTFVAVSARNSANKIEVLVDSSGRMGPWTYFGKFQ